MTANSQRGFNEAACEADGQGAALEVGDETVRTLPGRTFATLAVRRRAEAVSEEHWRGLF